MGKDRRKYISNKLSSRGGHVEYSVLTEKWTDEHQHVVDTLGVKFLEALIALDAAAAPSGEGRPNG